MFKRLLICTDFSDGLHRLVRFVPSLAAAGLKQITFLHTVPLWSGGEIPRVDTDKVEQARSQLENGLVTLPDTVSVKVRVESGRLIDAILRVAKDDQVDCIMMGTPTRTLLNEKLFGSSTVELCQRTSIPIMVIRPQLLSTYTSEELDLRCRHLFRYLLIPYDGSDTAKYLIAQVKGAIKQHPEAAPKQLHLCWIIEEGGRRGLSNDYQVQAAQQELAAVKSDLEALTQQVAPIEVREGNPVVEVLEVARMADVSAIALASGSLGKLVEWSIPSFTGELIRRSWHPIIYFPSKK